MDLSFHPVQKNGKRFVNINLKATERVRFQMSESQDLNLQRITWGVSTPQNPQLNANNECEKFNLDLSVESPELAKFLGDLDDRCEKEAVQHSMEWFGKTMERRDIDNKFNRILKTKDDGTHMVRVKINGETTKNPSNIWIVKECKGKEIEYFKGGIEHLVKDSKALVMVEASSVWFSKLFGISLNVVDILVWPCVHKQGIGTLNLPGVKLVEEDTAEEEEC